VSKQTIYDAVAARIVAELETGAAPWVKRWSTDRAARGDQRPHNAVTGRVYRGINVIILMMSGVTFTSSGWATYNQIKNAGGQVRRGEKSTEIVYFDRIRVQDRDDPTQQKVIPLLKTFNVFNVEQADWPAGSPRVPVSTTPDAMPDCEATIQATGADIRHGGAQAFYAPGPDYVQMPTRTSFKGDDAAAHYYATAFHELTHWTGHKSRLDRSQLGRFGDPDYAFEELVAELGSAFLCATHGVDGDLRHAGYIGNWMRAIKDDPSVIFKAASMAQRAADLIAPEAVEAAPEQQEALAA
jgi:antirestriction protein ArdC